MYQEALIDPIVRLEVLLDTTKRLEDCAKVLDPSQEIQYGCFLDREDA